MHKGHIEQEQQPKVQQAPSPQGQVGSGSNGKGDEETLVVEDEATAAEKKNTEQQKQQQQEGAEHPGETAAAAGGKKGGGEGEEEEENEIREEDVRGLYDDKTQLCEMPEARDPKLFVDGLTLRRYQRQALAWMIQREKKRYVTEEDCTGLSMGGGVPATRAAAGGATDGGPAEEDNPPGAADSGGGSSSAEGSASIRDGCVCVASWSLSATNGAGGSDCGGGTGVAMHPLWERRAAASVVIRTTTTAAATASGGGLFDPSEGSVDDDGAGLVPMSSTAGAAAAGEQVSLLSQPEAFYVNVYSRRFQREFPPASLGCRGGILADEMGMGKVTGWGGGTIFGPLVFALFGGGRARRGRRMCQVLLCLFVCGRVSGDNVFVDWFRCMPLGAMYVC